MLLNMPRLNNIIHQLFIRTSLTWILSLIHASHSTIMAWVYNRQAFDMSKSPASEFREESLQTPDIIAPFSRNLIMRWGEAFPQGVYGDEFKALCNYWSQESIR